MGQWRGKYLSTGPPRGPGHYSQDSSWWWGAQGAWLDDQRQRFDELHRQLLEEGWRPAGHGVHWWSVIDRRPDLDWETPADAYEQTQRSA
jgi:hypothetical protein